MLQEPERFGDARNRLSEADEVVAGEVEALQAEYLPPNVSRDVSRTQRRRTGSVFDMFDDEFNGGNVVNITAPYELKGAALQAHVAAAKAGVAAKRSETAMIWRTRIKTPAMEKSRTSISG